MRLRVAVLADEAVARGNLELSGAAQAGALALCDPDAPLTEVRIETVDGFPVLDPSFQFSIPGLYATSMMATRDFGPLFAFTVAVRASSRVVGDAIRSNP